jgi:molybdate transport system permease protein
MFYDFLIPHFNDLGPLVVSLTSATWATLLVMTVAPPLAWIMLRQRFRGQSIVEGLLLLPLILPPTVVGFALLYLLGTRSPLAPLWTWWGIDTLVFTPVATSLAAAIVAFPLMYRAAKGAFEQVDPLRLDAAISLGATPWVLFRTIVWAEAWPGLLSGLALSFGRALGEFGATVVVSGNIVGHTQTIPMALYSAIEEGDQASAVLWAIILGGLSVVLAMGVSRMSPRSRA